jgi:hypothetical protein
MRGFLQSKLDPEWLFMAGFNLAPGGRPPAPDYFRSQAALALYQTCLVDVEDRIRQAYDAQKAKFTLEMNKLKLRYADYSEPQLCAQVLLDRTVGLTVLFRCLMAHQFQLSDLVERFLPRACLQYLSSRMIYDLVWKDFLPAAFCQRALSYHREILQQLGPHEGQPATNHRG